MFRDDWVKRVVEQLATAIAAAVGRARAGGADQAMDELRRTGERELGMPRSTVDQLEPKSVLLVLGKERAGVVVQLLEGEAEVLDAAGRSAEADKRRARARVLREALGK